MSLFNTQMGGHLGTVGTVSNLNPISWFYDISIFVELFDAEASLFLCSIPI